MLSRYLSFCVLYCVWIYVVFFSSRKDGVSDRIFGIRKWSRLIVFSGFCFVVSIPCSLCCCCCWCFGTNKSVFCVWYLIDWQVWWMSGVHICFGNGIGDQTNVFGRLDGIIFMPFDRLYSWMRSDWGIYPVCSHRFGSLSELAANFVHRSSRMYRVPIDHFSRNVWCPAPEWSTLFLLYDISNHDYACKI